MRSPEAAPLLYKTQFQVTTRDPPLARAKTRSDVGCASMQSYLRGGEMLCNSCWERGVI